MELLASIEFLHTLLFATNSKWMHRFIPLQDFDKWFESVCSYLLISDCLRFRVSLVGSWLNTCFASSTALTYQEERQAFASVTLSWTAGVTLVMCNIVASSSCAFISIGNAGFGGKSIVTKDLNLASTDFPLRGVSKQLVVLRLDGCRFLNPFFTIRSPAATRKPGALKQNSCGGARRRLCTQPFQAK